MPCVSNEMLQELFIRVLEMEIVLLISLTSFNYCHSLSHVSKEVYVGAMYSLAVLFMHFYTNTVPQSVV